VGWEVIVIYLILVLVVLAFFREWASHDVIALTALGSVLITGILSLDQALSVFANPAPITIACMFVLSAGLERTGCIDVIGNVFIRLAGTTELRAIFVLSVLGALLSAFMNNTPVVVVFLPIVISLANTTGLNASRLLIPLSFASILGGTCTLTGSSTNLIIDGVAQQLGQPAFTMFEVSKLGIIYAVIGIAYLLTVGRRLLPHRETAANELDPPEKREFLTEFTVEAESSLIGKTLTESLFKEIENIDVVEVRRAGMPLQMPLDQLKIRKADRLLVAIHGTEFENLKQTGGIRFAAQKHLNLKALEDVESKLMEGIVGPRSTLRGKSLKQARFRQRFGVSILAVHRQGAKLRKNFGDIRLQFGDTLILEGPVEHINRLQKEMDFVNLAEREKRSIDKSKLWLGFGITACFIVGAALQLMPIVALALLAALAMILTRSIDTREAYAAIQWDIVFLILGMLALGKAMEASGAAEQLVGGITGFFGNASPYVLLAVIYLLSSTLTEMISNNAVAALLAPIVIGIAQSMDIEARPFIVAMMFGCSASFATPIGYQTNTYVYGAGGYKFTDFPKVGVPLNLILWVTAVLVIPLLWPFTTP